MKIQRWLASAAWGGWLFAALPGFAAVVGTNIPAAPLTLERIAGLPATEQPTWKEYLGRSERQRLADQAVLRSEMAQRGLTSSIAAPAGKDARSLPLERAGEWYASGGARHLADIVISFQTPAGGWSKNLDLSQHERAAGEGFAPDNISRFIGNGDNDASRDVKWGYVGTIDNGATTTELRFLAKVIVALPESQSARYRAAFARGVEYLFAAQFPNGGWPQVWPLQGGYHDAITYNDNAMLNVLQLLADISAGRAEFVFTAPEQRAQAATSLRRGLDCILATRVVVGGKPTVWCQQHDMLTLQPVGARNYEMPSLCSSESAAIVNFLMDQPKPGSNVVAAVRGAVAWFEKTQLRDVAFRRVGDEGRKLVVSPGSGPLWARYYEIGRDRPIFGDRDKSIHDDLNDISRERRDGYAWFNSSPDGVLRRFAKWNAAAK